MVFLFFHENYESCCLTYKKFNQQSWCSGVNVHLACIMVLDFTEWGFFIPDNMELVWLPVDCKRCLFLRTKTGGLVWILKDSWLKKTVRGRPKELRNVQWLRKTLLFHCLLSLSLSLVISHNSELGCLSPSPSLAKAPLTNDAVTIPY